MLKKCLCLLLTLAFAAASSLVILPSAAEETPDFDPVGCSFQNVHAPYMIEGGLPSADEFFTEADFAGYTMTVIDLWESACLFCRLALPEYQAISQEYAARGVRVLGVATTWMGGNYPACWGYLQEAGVTYDNVIIDDGIYELVSHNSYMPQTYFVDGSGTVVDYIPGKTSYEELTQKLEALLAVNGDADCNGVLNFADISSVYVFVLGIAALPPQGEANADFNKDGSVTFSDISEIYMFMLGAN